MPVNFTDLNVTNHYELKIDPIDHTYSRGLTLLLFFKNVGLRDIKNSEIKTIGDKDDCNPHAFLP